MLQNRVRVQVSGIAQKPMELYMCLECRASVLGSHFSEMCTFLVRKCTCSEKQLKCIGNYIFFRQRSWHPGIHSVFRALAPTSVRQILKILYFSVRNCYEIARIAEDFLVCWRIIGMRTRAMPRGQKRGRKEAPDMSVFRRFLLGTSLRDSVGGKLHKKRLGLILYAK